MCGICMVYNSPTAVDEIKKGILALEHRGQNGVGISVPWKSDFAVWKTGGMASDALRWGFFDGISGKEPFAVGHVRYPTFGKKDPNILRISAQPEVYHGDVSVVMCHNGNINNKDDVLADMGRNGVELRTKSECDVKYLLGQFMCELGKNEEPTSDDIFGAVEGVQQKVRGAYSATGLIKTKSGRTIGFAFRDPYGVRPIVVGRRGDAFMAASETTALDFSEFAYDFEPGPGEAVVFGNGGIERRALIRKGDHPCIFEFVYFASPDSVMHGVSVGAYRHALGYELARNEQSEFDVLVPILSSGLHHSDGYVRGMWDFHRKHVDLQHALVKRGGRIFIDPSDERSTLVRRKHAPIKYFLNGRRVATMDDSTVRGDTAGTLSEILYKAGAMEVHQRCSVGLVSSCFNGIDIPRYYELKLRETYQNIRNEHKDWTVMQVHLEAERRFGAIIRATSFRYNPADVVVKTLRGIEVPHAACINEVYILPESDRLLEKAKKAKPGDERAYESF